MGRTQDRTWQVHPEPDTGLVDEGAVAAAFQEAAVCVLRLGGAVTIAAARFQHPESGEWLNHRVVVRWTSFVPPIEPPAPWFAPGPPRAETLPGLGDDDLASLEGQFEPEPEEQPEPAEEPEPVLE